MREWVWQNGELSGKGFENEAQKLQNSYSTFTLKSTYKKRENF